MRVMASIFITQKWAVKSRIQKVNWFRYFAPLAVLPTRFGEKTDSAGKVIEHYGRKCQGFFEDDDSAEIEECDYRFRFKECPDCNSQNDIAARVCRQCSKDLVDPDEQLKAALKLKNAMVIRCSGMQFETAKDKLKITYYDEDGAEVSELFDLSNHKQQTVFNNEFGKRFNSGAEPVVITSVEQAMELQHGFTPPDFVVARKAKHYWQIQQKILRLSRSLSQSS